MIGFNSQAMDDAANEAENELLGSKGSTANYPTEGIDAVADWMLKWYMKAGYKRLGKILVGIAKDK